jgi:DNA-binding NtrC family response regulator
VELLARTFIEQIAGSYGLPVPELSAEARAALRAHRWPGNVRELRNVLERAVVLSPPGTLRLGPLGESPPREGQRGGVLPFPAPLAEVVRTAAQSMLELTGGNKSEAARRLGISRPRLQRLLDGHLEE